MGESREREDWSGKYIEHYDDEGNKIGESREREGWGGKYIEHTDAHGNKIGESREVEGFFGKYTEHTDGRGTKTGESHERENWGGKYFEHTDAHGNKIGESREREGLSGKYIAHNGHGWLGSRDEDNKSELTKSINKDSVPASNNYDSDYSTNYSNQQYHTVSNYKSSKKYNSVIYFMIFIGVIVATYISYLDVRGKTHWDFIIPALIVTIPLGIIGGIILGNIIVLFIKLFKK